MDSRMKCRAVVASVLSIAAVSIAGCGKDYSHVEFKQIVMNKTAPQVKDAIGDPNLIRDGQWFYFRKTYDGKTHKDDYKAGVTFKRDQSTGQNVVSGVDFYATSGS
jgi:hypothetical protein